MTAAVIASEAQADFTGASASLAPTVALGIFWPWISAKSAPPRFPAAVANHPAFVRPFNAKLIAIGMGRTMNEHRGLR